MTLPVDLFPHPYIVDCPMLPAPPAHRVSLACAQCRGRHMKCDGTTPICSRCRRLGISCEYHKSRRGGKRRRPVFSPANNDVHAPPAHYAQEFSEAPSSSSALTDERSSQSPAYLGEIRAPLVDQFYANFYASHPCVLPRTNYEEQRRHRPEELELLDLVMQFIGSLYHPDTPSAALEDSVKDCIARSTRTSGYAVQALVLYATAVYWRNDPERAHQLLDCATDQALDMGLHLRQFARDNSNGDAVLAESWRRTWWQLYLMDSHVAAISHSANLRTSQKNVPATVELPCEDLDYLTGRIPTPRTTEEYDNREFDLESGKGFSSFAYLIGLVRSFDLTMLGHQRETSPQSKSICINADCAVRSWLTLLPAAKRKIISEDGSFDELIFESMLIIPVYVVDMHRSLSTLKYDEIESISSCAPPPPPEHLPAIFRREAPIHTSKILHSIEAMMEVLLLPSRMSSHNPFIICMISSTAIAHLSACKHVLRGEQLRSARERVKVAIGALSSLAEVWPRAQRILEEVKLIARHLLGLGSGQNGPSSDHSQGRPRPDFDTIGHLADVDDWSLFDECNFADEDRRSPYELLSGFSGLISEFPLGAVSRAVSTA